MESGPLAVVVFGASRTVAGDTEYEQARLCGRLLAEAGVAVITGGYAGSMEGASRGAVEAGGHAIGVTAPSVFPERTGANRFVTREIAAPSLTERIHTMLAMADATIALPGSIGTLTELMVAWNLAFVARFSNAPAAPVVTVGDRWSRVVASLAAELETDTTLVTAVGTVPEAVAAVVSRMDPGRGGR